MEGINKVIDIYAERNKLLWKDNTNNMWLKSVVGNILDHIDDKSFDLENFNENLICLKSE